MEQKTRPSHRNRAAVDEYVESILSGRKAACRELIQACERYRRDLGNRDYDFNPTAAELVIGIIEKQFVHKQGEKLDGTPLLGEPFLLESWQKFCIYAMLCFYHKGTQIRRVNEAFIFVPRKNGKTSWIGALAWGLAILNRLSGSKIYITSAALQQSMQSFEFLLFNIKELGLESRFRVLNNNQENSINGKVGDGSVYIRALAANPDKQDSLNCNVGIADEVHGYKTPKQYNIIKEAMKSYSNKLMIGITTAGDNVNSFCYQRLQYCKRFSTEQ